MGFKVRKKVITRKSALQGWEEVELMTVVEWYVSGANAIRLLEESSINGERSCGMIDQQPEPGGNRWKGKTQMI